MHIMSAFLLSIVLIPPSVPIAWRLGLIDAPQGRRAHVGEIPRTGGLAMFVAFMVPVLDLGSQFREVWCLVLGLTLLVAAGVADDRLELRPQSKLVAQVAAVMVMIVPGPHLLPLSGLLDGSEWLLPEWLLIVAEFFLTTLFMVGVINAINMVDGVDGLAGCIVAAALLWIVIIAGAVGRPVITSCTLILLFATLGFLVFNMRHPWRRSAAVFMGDAGSMMLGACVAFFIVLLAESQSGEAVPLPFLLWIIALPVFDMVIITGRRIAAGRSPVSGDREHLHHLLLRAGVPVGKATAVIAVAGFCLGGCGALAWWLKAAPATMLGALIVPFLGHLYYVCHGWKRPWTWQELMTDSGGPVSPRGGR